MDTSDMRPARGGLTGGAFPEEAVPRRSLPPHSKLPPAPGQRVQHQVAGASVRAVDLWTPVSPLRLRADVRGEDDGASWRHHRHGEGSTHQHGPRPRAPAPGPTRSESEARRASHSRRLARTRRPLGGMQVRQCQRIGRGA